MTAFKRGTTVQWKQSYINQTWVSFMLIVRFSKPEGVSVMKCNLCPFGGMYFLTVDELFKSVE